MTLKIGTLEADIKLDSSGVKKGEKEVAKLVNKMEKEFVDLEKSAKGADDALDNIGDSGSVAAQGAKRAGDAAGEAASGGMKQMRHAAGQLGFQVQDIAVQLQSGTNAMVVLGQQGSQIAGIFGPTGAIVGAVIAIVAAIAGSLLPSLFKSETAIQTLTKVLDDLDQVVKKAEDDVIDFSDALLELEKISKTAFGAQIAESMLIAKKAIKDTKKEIIDLYNDADVSRPSIFYAARDFASGEASAREFADVVDKEFTRVAEASDKPNKKFRAFRNELAELVRGSEKAEEKLKRLQEAQTLNSSGSTKDTRDQDKAEEDILKRKSELAARLRERQEQEDRRIVAAENAMASSELEMARKATLDQEEVVRERYARLIAQTKDAQEWLQTSKAESDRIIIDLEKKQAEEISEIQRREAQKRLGEQEKQLNQQLAMVNQTSNAIANLLTVSGNNAAAQAASIISGIASTATTIATIMAAQTKAQTLGDPSAITMPQKIANVALMASQFAGIFAAIKGAKGGGRAHGGTVSPMLSHEINERGNPEILEQGGKQFLLPTGQGGKISPMKGGGSSGQMPSITINNNGTPQDIIGASMSNGEIKIMIDNMGRKVKNEINGSLATGRGDTYNSLKKSTRLERNLNG